MPLYRRPSAEESVCSKSFNCPLEFGRLAITGDVPSPSGKACQFIDRHLLVRLSINRSDGEFLRSLHPVTPDILHMFF